MSDDASSLNSDQPDKPTEQPAPKTTRAKPLFLPTYQSCDKGKGARTKFRGKLIRLGRFGSEESIAKFKALYEQAKADIEAAQIVRNEEIKRGKRLKYQLKHPNSTPRGPRIPKPPAPPKPPKPDGLTVKQFIAVVRKDRLKRKYKYPIRSRHQILTALRMMELCLDPQAPINSLVTADILRMQDAYIKGGWTTYNGKIAPPFSRQYTADLIGRIRCYCFWGAKYRHINPQVCRDTFQFVRKTPLHGYDSPGTPPVEWADVEATFHYMPTLPKNIIRFLWLSGCRVSEVFQIRFSEVDRSNENQGIWCWTPTTHKTAWRRKPKTVIFGPQAIEILKRYRPRRHADLTDYLFFSRRGKKPAMSTTTLNQHVKAAIKRATKRGHNLKPWNPIQLRHGRASEIAHHYGLDGFKALTGDAKAMASVYVARNLKLAIEIAKATG